MGDFDGGSSRRDLCPELSKIKQKQTWFKRKYTKTLSHIYHILVNLYIIFQNYTF